MPSFTPHLDRRYQLAGFDYTAGHTSWQLPFNDTAVNCLVIGDAFAAAGTVYLSGTIDGVVHNDFALSSGLVTLTASGVNYVTTDACILGVLYSMTIRPTRPFYRDQQGNADFVTRIGVRHLDVAYYQSGGFLVRRTMTGRANSDRTFAGDGTVTAVGKMRAHLNGNTKDAYWTVQSLASVPKRVVIPSISFDVDANARRDG